MLGTLRQSRLISYTGSSSSTRQGQLLLRQCYKYLTKHSNNAVANNMLFHQNYFSTSTINDEDHHQEDRLLVVGSGVAGSATALIAAEMYKIPVTLLFAGSIPEDCNSYWAQGGIIYRNYEEGDTADLLAKDIHRAGAGLCVDDAVQKVSEEGPERVRQLLLGTVAKFAKVPFDKRSDGELALCLEASHSAARILHFADSTGRAITEHITRAAAQHPLIRMQPHTLVTDLITTEQNDADDDDMKKVCIGVNTLHRSSGVRCNEYATYGVCLASGGLAGIYQHSTNPSGFNALGSSVALAVRAGARVRDLEYVQFHPTSLNIPNESRFLLTEALRGEGAILRDASGRAFAKDFHPDGELAPRDIVARGVFEQSQKTPVFLDITHRDREWLYARFPTIQEHLSLRGLDLAKDMLPVIPAAHYTCGGIETDLQGRTSLQGLYAAGEAARTGLHGGNRLASTSLLEGLVFGASVADYIAGDEGRRVHERIKDRLLSEQEQQPELRQNRQLRYQQEHSRTLTPTDVENAAYRAMVLLRKLRKTLWDHVGVVRTRNGLLTAQDELQNIIREAVQWHQFCPIVETCGLRDAAWAGMAVTQAALDNPVSAGAHSIVPDVEELEEEEMLTTQVAAGAP